MSSFSNYRPILKGVALAMLALFQPANADDEFNLRILELDTPLENTATLKNFIGNNSLLAGSYPVTIMWGRDIIDKRTVTFVLSDDKQRLLPELTKADLRDFGLKVDTLPDMKGLADSARVDDISHFIEGAQYDFNQDDQTLSLAIPQIYRDQTASGTINPKYWDDGASAAWASYQVSGSQQERFAVMKGRNNLLLRKERRFMACPTA